MIRMMMLLALAASTTPALAGTPDNETQSTRVRVADLNLSSAEGVAALDRRLHAAARAICDAPDISDLRALRRYRQCVVDAERAALAHRDAAIARARAQPALVALSR